MSSIIYNTTFRLWLFLNLFVFSAYGDFEDYEQYIVLVFFSLSIWCYKSGAFFVYCHFLNWFDHRIFTFLNVFFYRISGTFFRVYFAVCFILVSTLLHVINCFVAVFFEFYKKHFLVYLQNYFFCDFHQRVNR